MARPTRVRVGAAAPREVPVAKVARSIAIALAAVFLSASVAFAAGGPGVTVTHFIAFGNCSGDRIVQLGANGFVEDVETCVMAANAYGLAPGTYSIFVPEINGWFSDYDYLYTRPTDPTCDQPFSRQNAVCFNIAVSGTIIVTRARANTFIWNVTTFY
jgi:hypothetical protein